MAKNKKKKSKIASLDLKNYKAKYADSYGLGAEKPIDEEQILEEEPSQSEPPIVEPPKVEPSKIEQPKIETPPPKPEPKSETPPAKIEPPPKPEKPKPEKSELEQSEQPPPKEKFKDIVRRVENNKRKMQMREPVTVNVRREVKARPIGGIEHSVDDSSEREIPQHRRVESYGIAISAVALVYSFYIADKALFFMSMSLLSYLIRPIVGPIFGRHDQTVQNALKGFSIAVFFGAILFIFY